MSITSGSAVKYTCTLIDSETSNQKRDVQVYDARLSNREVGGGFCYKDPEDQQYYFMTAVASIDEGTGMITSLGFKTLDNNDKQINKVIMNPEFTVTDLLNINMNGPGDYELKEPVLDIGASVANPNVTFFETVSSSQKGGKRKSRRTKKYRSRR